MDVFVVQEDGARHDDWGHEQFFGNFEATGREKRHPISDRNARARVCIDKREHHFDDPFRGFFARHLSKQACKFIARNGSILVNIEILRQFDRGHGGTLEPILEVSVQEFRHSVALTDGLNAAFNGRHVGCKFIFLRQDDGCHGPPMTSFVMKMMPTYGNESWGQDR